MILVKTAENPREETHRETCISWVTVYEGKRSFCLRDRRMYILAVTPLHKWLRLNSVGRIRKLLTAVAAARSSVLSHCVSWRRQFRTYVSWRVHHDAMSGIDIALNIRLCEISGKSAGMICIHENLRRQFKVSVVRRDIGCCYFNAAENDISLTETR